MSVYSFSAFHSKKPSFVLWLTAPAMCHEFKETHVAHYTPVNHPEWKYSPTISCQYTMPEKRRQKNAWRPSSVTTFILKLWFMTKCNGLPVPGNVKPVYISYYLLNHRRGCHASSRHSMWPAIIAAQGGNKIALRGGGGGARKPICPTPPSPSLVAVPGGAFGLALPYLPCQGGGGRGYDPNIHGSK